MITHDKDWSKFVKINYNELLPFFCKVTNEVIREDMDVFHDWIVYINASGMLNKWDSDKGNFLNYLHTNARGFISGHRKKEATCKSYVVFSDEAVECFSGATYQEEYDDFTLPKLYYNKDDNKFLEAIARNDTLAEVAKELGCSRQNVSSRISTIQSNYSKQTLTKTRIRKR